MAAEGRGLLLQNYSCFIIDCFETVNIEMSMTKQAYCNWDMYTWDVNSLRPSDAYMRR